MDGISALNVTLDSATRERKEVASMYSGLSIIILVIAMTIIHGGTLLCLRLW